jgi:YD repeat-containing protein
MKKILILLLIIAAGCGTKTKRLSESETTKQAKNVLKQNDSILAIEKKITDASAATIDKVQEMNRNDESETTTRTTLDYDGLGSPLEVVTPKGRLRISGTGKVNVVSETSSRQSVAERNAELSTMQQYKISEVNYKNEIRNLTRINEASSSELVKEKELFKKQSRSVVWLWIVLVLSWLIILLMVYLKIRKRLPV